MTKERSEVMLGYSVFVGDVALDEYYRAPAYPALKEKVVVEMLPPQMGGMIANACCVYAAYGNPAHFCSVLNSTDAKLCHSLNQLGVGTDLVQFDDSLPDSKCIILLAEQEHTVWIVKREIPQMELGGEAYQKLLGARMIYSNYCELAPLRYQGLSGPQIAAEWKAQGVRLVCDIDVAELTEQTRDFLPYTHTLFMNEIGFANQKQGRTDKETARWFLDAGVQLLVVTYAEKGCVIYQAGQQWDIPGVPVPVVDVTGAGDTFCSSFTHLYQYTRDVQLCGQFACHAAALSITKLGARSGTFGAGPVLDFMRQQGLDVKILEDLLQKEAK